MILMKIETITLQVETKKEGDLVNLTESIQSEISRSGVKSGTVTVFVPGSTAAVTTTEFEPGAFVDLPTALQRIAPREADYVHHQTWGDDNGRSHVRASIIGPSLTVPFQNARLILGTWQQVILIELDTRPRRRKVVLQVMGE
jgi:secondary thiamine-phosphate synthase enzyme